MSDYSQPYHPPYLTLLVPQEPSSVVQTEQIHTNTPSPEHAVCSFLLTPGSCKEGSLNGLP